MIVYYICLSFLFLFSKAKTQYWVWRLYFTVWPFCLWMRSFCWFIISLPQGQYSHSQNHWLFFFIPILKIHRFCFILSFFFYVIIFFKYQVCWMCFAILGAYRCTFFSLFTSYSLLYFFLYCFGVLQSAMETTY